MTGTVGVGVVDIQGVATGEVGCVEVRRWALDVDTGGRQ